MFKLRKNNSSKVNRMMSKLSDSGNGTSFGKSTRTMTLMMIAQMRRRSRKESAARPPKRQKQLKMKLMLQTLRIKV